MIVKKSVKFNNLNSGSDNQQNSLMDEDFVRIGPDDAKRRLNQVFPYVNVKFVVNNQKLYLHLMFLWMKPSESFLAYVNFIPSVIKINNKNS